MGAPQTLYADIGDLTLAYEVFGEGEPVLLIMGIGSQMLLWPDGFCEQLARRGYKVIRFDNRDVGLSTRLKHLPAPDPRQVVKDSLLGRLKAPYSLSDMAADAAHLLDALGHDRAHVVGASMGGMIAQHMALEHAGHVRTLTLMMTADGSATSLLGKPAAMKYLLSPVPRDREGACDWQVGLVDAIRGKGFQRDEELVRDVARRCYDRGPYPKGFLRHFAAIRASGSRAGRLAGITSPTLVMHGSDDPLILHKAGKAVARGIPGARFHTIEGMGHDLPRGAWPELVEELVSHFQQGGPPTG